jgi:transcriptional regulator with XRE-family HTH domain
MDELRRLFGENLERLRCRADLSQEELGFRAGLHRTEVGMLERGARMPRLDTIVKLAGGLEVEPAELLEGMIWRPGSMRPGHFGSLGGKPLISQDRR